MLTLYGATGYTGRLVAAEAVRRGLPVRLAGRRRSALAALAADLPGSVETAVADAADSASLQRLASESSVLLTTVGPYERWGRPVVEAALAGGAHYVDVTGEVPFLAWVYQQEARAVAAGAALCPAVGFDGVPGELLARHAADRLAGPIDTVRVAYRVTGGRPSAGTVRSALGIAARGGAAWAGGRLVEEPAGAHAWEAPFPDRSRGAISVPFPEAVTVGRSTGASEVRAYATVPFARLVSPFAVPSRVVVGAVAHTPVWGLLQQAVDQLPRGPAADVRERARATVLAEVRGAAGVQRAVAWLSDMYQTTARSAVAVAERLLTGTVEPGVRTPSQVVGDPGWLLERMGGIWRYL